MSTLNETVQTTGALEGLPSVLERQSAHHGKRPRIIEEKNTDILSPLTSESPNAKVAWRQVAQLRKENMYLRAALEAQRTETKNVQGEYQQLQAEFDEVVAAQQGHEQDLASYQTRLQELTDERNQLLEAQQTLEERYQALQKSFDETIQEEAHKLMQEAVETALQSPDDTSPLVRDAVKTVELHLRQEKDKHLIEALCLKREVQRMANILEQEQQQLQQERQQLLSFQVSMREQAKTRQLLHEQRLSTHQKVVSLVTSFSLLALFLVLEFVCLALFHTPFAGSVALSIIIPIVVCIGLGIVLKTPLNLLKYMYRSAPHRRPVKA